MLFQCTKNFEKLLDIKYHFEIARKGVIHTFDLTFQKTDFHHLAGLHKLTDKRTLQHNSREKIFNEILEGKITQQFIESSSHYSEISDRLSALINLETLLDSDNLIFKYNENVRLSSNIKAEFLLEGFISNLTLFLFLGSRDTKTENQQCRSFFPKSKIDYSIGQPKYTLLRKTKTKISTGEILLKYEKQ